jgi:hypothetical protein
MYAHFQWEGPGHIVQYVAVGDRANRDLDRRYPRLRQITWEHISDFLFRRFSAFPEKLGVRGRVHDQWPDFGKKYGQWVYHRGRREPSVDAVRRYLETGSCLARPRGRGSRP